MQKNFNYFITTNDTGGKSLMYNIYTPGAYSAVEISILQLYEEYIHFAGICSPVNENICGIIDEIFGIGASNVTFILSLAGNGDSVKRGKFAIVSAMPESALTVKSALERISRESLPCISVYTPGSTW